MVIYVNILEQNNVLAPIIPLEDKFLPHVITLISTHGHKDEKDKLTF